mmetsp:Transcript_21229/g.57122  ORF Transcript_21229/g.57122 Transcript_21229/m.57122 type:complete len:287 (-) Transcript_21229:342-1202(-)
MHCSLSLPHCEPTRPAARGSLGRLLCKRAKTRADHLLLILVLVLVVIVVVRRLHRHAHRVLLGLDGRLALGKRALGLRVQGLVRILLLGGLVGGVLADLLVDALVHLLQRVALDLLLDELGKLRLVALGILLLEQLHVLRDVAAEDVLLVRLGVKLLALTVVAREALLRVRDVQATVHRALERAEDAVAGRRAHEADVKHARERALLALLLDEEHLAIGRGDPLVVLIELELLEEAARGEQAGAVARGVVGQANLEAVLRQLVGVRGADDDVANNLGVDNLADYVL